VASLITRIYINSHRIGFGLNAGAGGNHKL
jgi:hypothetical protein